MKRILSLFLSITIVISLIMVFPLNVYADYVDDTIISRINKLYSLLGNSYFTTTRESAGNKESSCLNSNVIASSWFVDKFAISGLSTSQFPTCARYPSSRNAYSCTGFSLFAEWYIFKNSNSDYISTNKLSKMDFNYNNVAENAKVGDIISLSGNKYSSSGEYRGTAGHEVIFISADSSGITVLDSNWGNGCKVTRHTIGYYYCDYFQIARATNRNSVYDYTDAPCNPELHIYTNCVAVDYPILFEYSAENAQNMYIAIDVDGKREHFIEVSGDHYNGTFSKVGHYAAALYCRNNVGDSGFSNWVEFDVYDTPPTNPKLKTYTNNVASGSSILFEYSVENAENMYIAIDVDGKREHFIEVTGDHYDGTFTKAGHYAAALYCRNPFGYSGFSNWVEFDVYDTPPTNPKLNVYKSNVVPGEPILFEYSVENAENMYIAIDVDGKREHFIEVTGDHYNGIFTNIGHYAAALYCKNPFGYSGFSNWVEFDVGIFTVTFNANGGYTSEVKKSVTYNETYGTLTTPIRTGYMFNGWYTAKSGGTEIISSSKVSITDNQTLYAQWTPITYSVKYNANGGSGIMSNSSHTYDVEKALNSNSFAREGYKFKGWNTAPDGSGTAYADGASVKNLTAENGGTVTLYAQWERSVYTESILKEYSGYSQLTVDIHGINKPARVIAAYYKDGRLVNAEVREYTSDKEIFALIGDFDTVKVMAWDGLDKMAPLTEAEILKKQN